MIVALGQDQRGPAVLDGVNHVVRDTAIARRVVDEFLIESLELQPLVGIWRPTEWNPVGCTRTKCSNGRAAACARALTR